MSDMETSDQDNPPVYPDWIEDIADCYIQNEIRVYLDELTRLHAIIDRLACVECHRDTTMTGNKFCRICRAKEEDMP